jgi:hypothetical protein
VFADKIAHDGLNLATPFTAIEDPIMANLLGKQMLLFIGR